MHPQAGRTILGPLHAVLKVKDNLKDANVAYQTPAFEFHYLSAYEWDSCVVIVEGIERDERDSNDSIPTEIIPRVETNRAGAF